MGQTCSQVSSSMVSKMHEIQNVDFLPDHPVQESGEVICWQDHNRTMHKIPKASQINVKTLTEKNQQSQKKLFRKNRQKRRGQIRQLQFFKQFDTLKDLIQGKNKQELGQSSISSQSSQKQNIQAVLQQGLFQRASLQISNSLSKYIMSQQQQQKVFQTIQINIADFIRISQQPITEYYQFKEKIGEGSFGNVYRAICKTSGQERAIKVLKKKQMSKQNKKEFMAEMELLSKLDHPNIIKVYELYYYNSFYYVVTEYCKGGTILKYINENSNYGQKFVSKIIKQLLSALQYLHQNLVVHLDIKLENVVFLEKFQNQDDKVYIKLIDFGCSKTFVPYKKKKGKISGTLSYIAPQCLKGYFSEKCDIWSTGVLLHILLSGMSPFKGRDSKQTMSNIENKDINFETKSWSKISPQAKELISFMLDRNPTRRISAKSSLQHKWFQKIRNTRSTVIQHEVLKNLQKYYRGNNLVTIIETFLSIKKINQQERKRLTDIFTLLDTDNSGSIQVSQLFEVYQKNFGHHDISEVQHIINKIDLNKSSSINFNEFLVAMTDRKKMFEFEHLQQAFNYFDLNKTGFIEKNELKEILKGCQKQQFEFILKQLDKDGDQKISKQEFITYLSKF